jgi:hypothetical protein
MLVGNAHGRTLCDDVYDESASRTASPPTHHTQDYPLDLDHPVLLYGMVRTPIASSLWARML